MNFDNQLFRCSQLGELMTEPRGKSELISETTKTKLTEIFIKEKYSREKDITNKYMEKGTVCEEDSIGLVDCVRKKFTLKNKERFQNEFIIGTPDIITEDEVEDLKTSWDIFTFFKADVTKGYDWQLEAYCILTGKKYKRLTYVLVNSPAHLIDDEKRKMSFAIHDISGESELYMEKAKAIERNMIFDMEAFKKENQNYPLEYKLSEWDFDIPKEKRIKSFELERIPNSNEIIQNKVILWRSFLNQLNNN